jgi:hypothetical protein
MSKEQIEKKRIEAYNYINMKEQTPITAEELFKQNELIQPISKIEAIDLMEQYANTKVLEALEREVPIAFNEDPHNRDYPAYMGYKSGIEYYEAKVKQKYKL